MLYVVMLNVVVPFYSARQKIVEGTNALTYFLNGINIEEKAL
jgi:hypothetical protein